MNYYYVLQPSSLNQRNVADACQCEAFSLDEQHRFISTDAIDKWEKIRSRNRVVETDRCPKAATLSQ